jgi:hypothetical protein
MKIGAQGPVRINAAQRIPKNDIPADLAAHIAELEEWALDNRKDGGRALVFFWILKIPAITASAGAGLSAQYDHSKFSLILSAVAGISVLIDGILNLGALRGTYVRAFHDIRSLTNRMATAWRVRDPNLSASESVRKIIMDSEAERTRIAQYVRDAEASLSLGANKA